VNDSDADGGSGGAKYVAIITDGNGRWAQARDLPVAEGHKAGADVVKARLRDAAEFGIRELTVYSFSTENWARPAEEVTALMRMFSQRILSETPELKDEGVRMRFIGRRDRVAGALQEQMDWAEAETAANDRITLFVAFNYGGRAEIVDAAARFEGGSEEDFRALLYAPDMHDPDLVIRTSGEQRMSNYLLWQSAYSELVFRDELWPDFSREAFRAALDEYEARTRRFGGRCGMPQARRRQAGGGARRSRGGGCGSDLGARILVAIPALAVALTMVALGGTVFAVGVGVLGLICLHELFSMFERARPARLAGFVGFVGLLVAASLGDRETILLAFLACIPLVFIITVNQAGGGGAPAISVTLLGLAWIGLALAHAVLLRDLPHGGGLVFAVLLGTFVGDTGAYLGGRAFGRRPLAPTISPNKTIEGLAIGVVIATAAVWWAGLSQEWFGGTKGAIMGISIALAAPLGDLFESYLKRDANTKDTGTLFGAHGGALDRLDAILFTAVVGFYVWLALT
jgi:undecaprenyl diphosphate synthase